MNRFSRALEAYKKWHEGSYSDFVNKNPVVKELVTRKWDLMQ